jgi:HlyD family secretion protein
MKYALALFSLAAIAACAEEPPSNEVRAAGHVEATEVRIAPDLGGRIVERPVEQGDRVEAGRLILRLDARDLTLGVERAKAEQRQAEAQLRLLQAGARREDIAQAAAQAQAGREEVEAARAELTAADLDLQRFEALLQSNAGSRKQRDDAATRRDVARERLRATESRWRAAEQVTARLRAGTRAEEIEAARARVAAAQVQVASAEKMLSDATVRAPIGGIVSETLAEMGEVIAPRAPVAVIVDLVNVWADVFVAEPLIPRLRLNQPATVYTDAGGAGIAGTVTYISPKAEFTPRNVQTSEERSKLVYRVRVSVTNSNGVLKQGMPVDAVLPLQQP